MRANACKLGLEGIISKRFDAPYTAARTMDCQKTKCLARQEFVAVGYAERTNAPGDFGSLLLAAHEKRALVYAGNVGTGWSDRQRRALYEKLVKLEAKKPAVALPKDVSASGLHWLKPNLVVEVAFTGWTNDGLVRHPSFQGLREDKAPEDVVIERPAAVPGLKGGDWGRKRR